MAVEQHPQYAAGREALDRLVEAERRYHIALEKRERMITLTRTSENGSSGSSRERQ